MTWRERPNVVVVGAGISGLTAAYELTGGAQGPSDHTPSVTILEASEQPGGKIQSVLLDGRILDAGPDGVLARRPEIAVLCRELGIDHHLVPIAAKGASVYARGQVRALPDGLIFGIPTDPKALRSSRVLSRAGYLRVLRDRFAPVPSSRGHLQDRAIGSLVETKLGKEVVTVLVDPMLGGINAGRVAEMSAAAVYPPLLEAAQQRGSLMAALRAQLPVPSTEETTQESPAFTTLDGGMHSLIATLVDVLLERSVQFKCNTSVSDLVRGRGSHAPWTVNSQTTTTPADGVVIAVPAQQAATLVKGIDEELSSLLHTIDYASVAIVTFIFNEHDLPLPESGTGVLIPPETSHASGDHAGERFLSTALTFLDRKWPHLNVDGQIVLRVHMGRIDDTRTIELSDDELTARAREELALLFQDVGSPLASVVTRWETSLPQYRVNHLMRVAAIENAVHRFPALAVAGAAYRGVGVPACIASGRAAGITVREAVESLPA